MLTFNEERHEYRWDGAVVPGVTTLLKPLQDWGMVPPDILEAARERGTDVHALCHYHDEGDLDPATIGDKGAYLDAWIEFCSDYGAAWHSIERRGYSKRFGFAGTWDRMGILAKRFNRQPWVVDIKTSAQRHRVMGLQLAAYRQIAAEEDPAGMLARRATVQLLPTGKYVFHEWNDPTDWATFQALITLTNWSNK